ncbi:MAG TPA: hypothetical protein VIP05_33385 [Burkholderiaceae bacterium]
MNVVKSPLSSFLVVAGALLACVSAQAAPTCASVTPVERRIVERANGEIESLRSFVNLTNIAYGINMIDVRDHLDQWRTAVECHNQVAAAERAAALAAAGERAAPEAAVHVAAR